MITKLAQGQEDIGIGIESGDNTGIVNNEGTEQLAGDETSESISSSPSLPSPSQPLDTITGMGNYWDSIVFSIIAVSIAVAAYFIIRFFLNRLADSLNLNRRQLTGVNHEAAGHTSQWAMPLDGDRTPEVLVDGPFRHYGSQVSPDGRWLAYASDQNGRFEVYVQRFREASPRVRLSSDGGSQPLWRADGRELFYLALDGQLMSLAVEGDGEFGGPQPLFDTAVVRATEHTVRRYAVSPDGQRFLIVTPEEAQETARIVVMTNWAERLAR